MSEVDIYKEVRYMNEAAKRNFDDTPDAYEEERGYYCGIIWATEFIMRTIVSPINDLYLIEMEEHMKVAYEYGYEWGTNNG